MDLISGQKIHPSSEWTFDSQKNVLFKEEREYRFLQLTFLIFGLIIASAIVIFGKVEKVSINVFIASIIGLIISSYIALEAPSATPNTDLFIFLSGAIAISAMILPGISGSFILVFLSKYEFILNSLNNFDIAVISIFIAGCVVGLVTFSRVFSYLFKKYNDIVVSVLVGFLLGSLFKVWPFYKVLEYDAYNEPIYTSPAVSYTHLTLPTKA